MIQDNQKNFSRLQMLIDAIVIAVTYAIQKLIGESVPLREVVITFYICNEALSLLENAAIFIPIPERIEEILLQLRDKSKGE